MIAALTVILFGSSYALGGVMAAKAKSGRKRGTPSKGTKADKRFKKNK
ncbi:hypothetical protein SEA_HEXBUG_4 [Gordonia phage Hexbug]|nr:hypothetical protein SEA_HEXBUG_4 [Gordonia phage Hexbug]WNN96095.1 hypothetical protein SEA_NODIGI_4 [Gordonia phage Nodigi]